MKKSGLGTYIKEEGGRGGHNHRPVAVKPSSGDAIDHTRPISRRREQLCATHCTGPSTLSVQVLHGHNIASRGQGKTFLHSLQIRPYKEHNGITPRLPRRHLHVVGERLEDQMKHVRHGTWDTRLNQTPSWIGGAVGQLQTIRPLNY